MLQSVEICDLKTKSVTFRLTILNYSNTVCCRRNRAFRGAQSFRAVTYTANENLLHVEGV